MDMFYIVLQSKYSKHEQINTLNTCLSSCSSLESVNHTQVNVKLYNNQKIRQFKNNNTTITYKSKIDNL